MVKRFATVVLLSALLAGCAAGRAFRRGEEASRQGDWDTAVIHYTRAVQEAPDRPDYKVMLERAMQNAALAHLSRARELEEKNQLDLALAEYRKSLEYDSSNRTAQLKAAALERQIRERVEAARPKPRIEQLREQARKLSPEPLLNPASRDPIRFTFQNAAVRDILNTIGSATGINITYDQQADQAVGRPYSVNLDGVTLEEALNQVLTANSLFYKVINPRTIIIAPDIPAKRAQYEELVIRTFFLSHADATELTQMLNQIARVPQGVQPAIMSNKTANTITIRTTAALATIIERVIRANDKPRAEIVLDVQILEVNRSRLKEFGLNLSSYSVNLFFSPEQPPTTSQGAVTTSPFNLNTITQGVSTADFYLAVPTAVVRFLESDSHSRVLAKPQLRGAEGEKLTLNLGQEVPILQTVFGAAVAGGFASIPQSSFTYRTIGVILEMTPRVTYEGEIILQLGLENSSIGAPVDVAGQSVPSFQSRKVATKLRLREGESNLLAGLIQQSEQRALSGLPGVLRLPVMKQLFSANSNRTDETDIVMLITPHIVRTHELTAEDLAPIFIGTQSNIGLGGPPPLIAPTVGESVGAEPPKVDVAGAPSAAAPGVPPGTAPTPGQVPPVTPPRDRPEPAPPATEEPAARQQAAQVIVTPPGTEFRVGSGPYTVPISINGVSRASMTTITLTFNPTAVRARNVQEGSFMRQGGIATAFSPRIDAAAGRVDIVITRLNDATGASGSGLLAGVLFDAIAPGSVTFAVSGTASDPEGAPIAVQFNPVTVTVR